MRSLGRLGLRIGAAEGPGSSPPAFRSRWCARAYRLPDVGSSPDAYVDDLLEILSLQRVPVLVASHDGSIEALRSRRTEVAAHTGLALALDGPLGLAVDKERTLEVARALGLPVPIGRAIEDPSQISDLLEYVGLPAVVKPTRSWVHTASRGCRLAAQDVLTGKEARRAVDTIVSAGGRAVLQQWLPGRREAISVFRARGRVWAEFAQLAHRMYPPLGGSSVVRESIAVPEDAGAAARALVEALDLDGYAEIEFRRDKHGTPMLMEINPRLSASVELSVRAGVNFPEMVYRWAAGQPLTACSGYRVGLRMRWLGGDLAWLRDTWRQQGRPDVMSRPAALATFLADFARETRYDYVDAGDLTPAWSAAITAARHLGAPARRVMAHSLKSGPRHPVGH